MTSPSRPRVIANFALTLDGKVSTKNGTPSGFAGPTDKVRLRQIRALGDAILVGASTAGTDSMSLRISSAELRSQRVLRGQTPQPLRVLVSNSGKIDPNWKIFASPHPPIELFTKREHVPRLCNILPIFCTVHPVSITPIPLRGVLEVLHSEHNVDTVVCEGGPRLLRSLVVENLLDEIYITFSRNIFGGLKAPTLTGLPGGFLPPMQMQLLAVQQADGEIFAHYQVTKKSFRNTTAMH